MERRLSYIILYHRFAKELSYLYYWLVVAGKRLVFSSSIMDYLSCAIVLASASHSYQWTYAGSKWRITNLFLVYQFTLVLESGINEHIFPSSFSSIIYFPYCEAIILSVHADSKITHTRHGMFRKYYFASQLFYFGRVFLNWFYVNIV